jgi:hypothetical protein
MSLRLLSKLKIVIDIGINIKNLQLKLQHLIIIYAFVIYRGWAKMFPQLNDSTYILLWLNESTLRLKLRKKI